MTPNDSSHRATTLRRGTSLLYRRVRPAMLEVPLLKSETRLMSLIRLQEGGVIDNDKGHNFTRSS